MKSIPRRWTSLARLSSAALLAAALPAGLLYIRALACGPDWEPDVFVPQHHPASPALYADGNLGVIQRTYYHSELVVAYRYLNGGRLSPAEKAALLAKTQPAANQSNDWKAYYEAQQAAEPANQWRKARAAVAMTPQTASTGQSKAIQPQLEDSLDREFYVNCADHAFLTAIETLRNRSATWAATSPELQEWLRGQDAVFSNCKQPGHMPDAAQAQWPVLLQQDRAYQIGAAEFYTAKFDDAISAFEGIARDKASPWSRWGEYLAARAEVRKAASMTKGSDSNELASFDKDTLEAAQARLTRLVAGSHDAQVQHAAKLELQFIQVRLDPTRRLDAAANALAGPGADPEFRQDLTDLDFLLDHGTTGTAPLARWIQTMQGPPDKQTTDLNDVPSLLASLSAANTPDSKLMAAAASVPISSAAYVTVNFHRARLLRAAGKPEEVRAITTMLLKGVAAQDSGTRNALLQMRLPTARSFDQYLADTPRTLVEGASQTAYLARCDSGSKHEGCYSKLPSLEFDNDAAQAFNKQLPLALWVQAAQSTTLPQHLRDAVAWAGWLRALGLNDSAARRQLAPMLPTQVKATAGDSDGFPATLALLRNPGMQPYLLQGVQRSASFHTFDELRDNWWCSKWADGDQINQGNIPGAAIATEPGPLPFLMPVQRDAAAGERARLNTLPNATVWLGRRTLDYIQAHAEEKDAAEALALVVRATHYSCSGQEDKPEQHAVSRQAFELLHKRYPTSDWARKTRYYY